MTGRAAEPFLMIPDRIPQAMVDGDLTRDECALLIYVTHRASRTTGAMTASLDELRAHLAWGVSTRRISQILRGLSDRGWLIVEAPGAGRPKGETAKRWTLKLAAAAVQKSEMGAKTPPANPKSSTLQISDYSTPVSDLSEDAKPEPEPVPTTTPTTALRISSPSTSKVLSTSTSKNSKKRNGGVEAAGGRRQIRNRRPVHPARPKRILPGEPGYVLQLDRDLATGTISESRHRELIQRDARLRTGGTITTPAPSEQLSFAMTAIRESKPRGAYGADS
jgi:hypothetical protein